MKNSKITLLVFLLGFLTTPLLVRAESKQVYSKLPVKEVTIFKDGHAFVLHEGTVKTKTKGNVLLDYLPNPVMGTFWAYSAQPNVALTSVISSRDELDVEQAALSIEDLVKGNAGKKIIIKETSKNDTYQATILRTLDEEMPPSASVPNDRRNHYYQPVQHQNKIVLLKAAEGIKAVPLNQIQSITFLDNPSDTVNRKQQKDTMTLQLDWNGQHPESQAVVGMAYIQRGIRWIPNYRVEINDQGQATIKLQATIVNELADMEDVKAHLVIGVPRFAFKDTPDPISFQETVARLSQHFSPNSSTAYAFSNAIMSQRAAYDHAERPAVSNENNMNLGPELQGMETNEDLFVFTLDHITLKKGQRMVLPIAEYTLNYTDVYTVDIGFQPPLEMRRNFNTNQHLELAKLFHAPKAIHKIRLKNKSEYPLTTAPATIFKNGRVLAQGMMTYTSIGGEGDLEITTAVNIKVKNSDTQTATTPNAVKWNGDSYTKVDMLGNIELTNYSDKPVTLHIKRSILGNMDEATHKGTVKQLGHGYDGFVFEGGVPFWWNWCSWPWWWYHFNSVGQTDWEIELEPKEEIKLEYNWYYYWR